MKKQIKTIAIASGTPGVGKTNFTANLAVTLQKRGKKVMILDTAPGTNNIRVLLRACSDRTLRDVLNLGIPLAEAVADGPHGIELVSAGPSPAQAIAFDSIQCLKVLDAVEKYEGGVDVLLVDMAGGISDSAAFFCSSVQEIVIVASPFSTAIAEESALVRFLNGRHHKKHFHLLVNPAEDGEKAFDLFRRISLCVEDLTDVSIDYLGYLPFDDSVSDAMRARRAFVDLYPWRPLSQKTAEIAEHFLSPGNKGEGTLQFFIGNLLIAGHPAYPLDS